MRKKIIIDADTGNEIDDLYAIARALKAPELEILGICSTHYRAHDNAPKDSVEVSHALNLKLLKNADRSDIPVLRGSNLWMGHAWGGREPADSDAVQFIIKSAKELKANEKLHVATQGAMTNIASAIAIEPSIAEYLEVHIMGFRYNPDQQVWDKNDFNVRNDLNAADNLLNCSGLNLHIMTSTTSECYLYPKTDTFEKLSNKGALQDFLLERWSTFVPGHLTHWIMWDLALIQAIISPSLATTRIAETPPENLQRKIEIYDSINVTAMMDDFFTVLG
jgi:purine nucleosidase